MKLEVTYENFKALDSGNFNVDGNIIIVQGQNKTGKSSLINGILENLNAKSISKEPQTRESKTKKGYKIVTVLNKKGEEITVYHEFEKGNPKGEFYAEKADGTKVQNVTEIRELIGDIAPYTVEDFFQKSKYTEGRRDIIKNIFKKMLKEKEVKEIEDIEGKLDTKKGTLYLERREKNTFLKSENTNLEKKNNEIISILESLKITSEDDALKELKKLEESQIDPEQIAKISRQVEMIKGWINDIDQLETTVSKISEKEQNKFKNNIFKFNTGNAFIKEFFENMIKEREKITSKKIDQERKDKLANLKQLISTRNEVEKSAKNLVSNIDKINKEMDTCIERRNEILTNANLPNELMIESESDFSYNGFEFNENEVSESEAWLIILEIMMQIYSGKLIFAGNASIYDKNSKAKILELAQKYDKQVMLEQVHEDMEEVSMVAYVNEETSQKQNKMQNKQEKSSDDKTSIKEKKSVKQTENTSKNEMEEKGYDKSDDEMDPKVDTSKDPFGAEETNQEKSKSNDDNEEDPFGDGINLFGSADFDD
jgi:hypothetical protein